MSDDFDANREIADYLLFVGKVKEVEHLCKIADLIECGKLSYQEIANFLRQVAEIKRESLQEPDGE